jgi:predicted metal-dependent HD superfamily phosphohydrolase
MSKKNNIKVEAQAHVFELFKKGDNKPLIYHNYNHTLEVVDAAKIIGKGSGLSKEDLEIVELAAWFHDVGYQEKSDGHEKVSSQYATDFLEKGEFDEDRIALVTSAIIATKYPQQPNTLLEKVLCDADLSHLGTKSYLEKCQLLRFEGNLINDTDNDDLWIDHEIQFLSNHRYHTEFAQREYAKMKSKNILMLRQMQISALNDSKKLKEKEQKEITKKLTPERGIETMFRVSFRNHMALSVIADNKANIMLSINAIIISILLSTLVPSFDSNPALIIPSTLLLLVCIVTIVFATLSTRPKISAGTFTRDDIKQKKPNLLFFGNFHGMPLNEFEWGMEELMKNRDYLYGSMIKDFYSLGTVLAKKYKYLRICYTIFMFGMIASILAFIVSFIVNR